MNSNGVTGSFYKMTEWIMRLAYINVLWIFFSLLGILLFGAFPATVSMFTVCRKMILGESDIPIFRTFWKIYKQEFFKSNLIGLIIVIVSCVFYVDYLFFDQGETLLIKVMLLPFLALSIICLLTIFFIFPTYVHYEAKMLNLIKNAFLITLINPLVDLLMILSTIIVYILMVSIPGLIPFFGVSILAWIYMYLANISFNKIDRNKNAPSKKISVNSESNTPI